MINERGGGFTTMVTSPKSERKGEGVFRTYFINNRGDEQMGNTWNYVADAAPDPKWVEVSDAGQAEWQKP
jgi:predicted dithiol-disulfide oxidoreductase (DUF899 family)